MLTATSTVRAVGGTVTLLAGDNVVAPAGSLISGANGVTIRGDANDLDGGVGARIGLSGTISGSLVLVQGGSDVDLFGIVGIQAATTIEAGGEAVRDSIVDVAEVDSGFEVDVSLSLRASEQEGLLKVLQVY